jgi:3-oxoacyl-[acyl-carrier protein] reductase
VSRPSRVALVSGHETRVGGAIADALGAAGLQVRTEPGDAPDSLDIAVYARVPRAALPARPLVGVDEQAWIDAAEQPLRDFVVWMQAVYEPLARRRGTAVLVAPTASQEGAAGLVPYTTAVEGQRLLAKSVARQWAGRGITVLTVAPRLDAVVDIDAIGAADAVRTDPSLGPDGYDPRAVARVVVMLTDPVARVLTGATVPVDGGALLAP